MKKVDGSANLSKNMSRMESNDFDNGSNNKLSLFVFFRTGLPKKKKSLFTFLRAEMALMFCFVFFCFFSAIKREISVEKWNKSH